MGGKRLSDPDITRAQRLLSIDENQSLRQDVAGKGWQNESDPAPYGSECNDLVLPSFLCRQETPEYWPEYKHGAVQSIGPQTRAHNSIGMGDHTPENFPQYKPSFGTEHEFCIKLSMANIEGRPLSVTLARVGDPDTPIIGCSPGFLALCGLPSQDVVGRNARFLNQRSSMTAECRHRLQYSVKTGMPFMGVIGNKRHCGGGVWEDFENLMHLVVISAGNRKYFLGIQVNVTGLNLKLDIGGDDAKRLQCMFDAVLSAQVDSWIHIQEGALHTLPLYLYIRPDAEGEDQVELVEGALCGQGPALAAPDQYLVLTPQFSEELPTDVPLMWQTLLLGSVPTQGAPMKHDQMPRARQLGPQTVGDKQSGHNYPDQIRAVLENQESCQQPLYLESPSGYTDAEAQSGWKKQLKSFRDENPAAILVARGITKLGHESGSCLTEYFRPLCGLKNVQVPCQYKKRRGSAKTKESKPQEQRVPGRAFIVLSSPEEASRMLAAGPEYLINGVVVTLAPFELHDTQDA